MSGLSNIDQLTTWRRAFCLLYDVDDPVVSLGNIMHWRAVVQALDCRSPLDDQSAYVSGSYFYRPHSEVPDIGAVDEAMDASRHHGAKWTLFPAVRGYDPIDRLNRSGFVGLPWFVEAEYERHADVDTDLRSSLGGNQFRRLLKAVRRSDEQFNWHATVGEKIDQSVLSSFCRLHEMNIAKYGHIRNHFSLPILEELVRSPIRQQLCIFWYRRREDDLPVQAMLGFLDPRSGELELWVQGRDGESIPASLNLYRSGIYQVLRWAEGRGVQRVNLGRGAEVVKLQLGANRFHVVSNFLASNAIESHSDLGRLSDAATRAIRDSIQRLQSLVEQRRVTGDVELPKSVGGRDE